MARTSERTKEESHRRTHAQPREMGLSLEHFQTSLQLAALKSGLSGPDMLWRIPTKAEDRVVLHQRPGVVVHTVVLVDQELADVSGRHVGGDLHHLSRPILAPHLHYLETHEQVVGIWRQGGS